MLIKNLFAAKKTTPLPLTILTRVAQSSPLFALGAWFLYRTERGERIRRAVVQKVSDTVGLKPAATA